MLDTLDDSCKTYWNQKKLPEVEAHTRKYLESVKDNQLLDRIVEILEDRHSPDKVDDTKAELTELAFIDKPFEIKTPERYWMVPSLKILAFTERRDIISRMTKYILDENTGNHAPRPVFVLYGLGGSS